MDVAEQIQKHLARDADKTIPEIDEYCEHYKELFFDVRSYECFKYLHLGIITSIKRKSFAEISKVVGVSSQSLHHFITKSPWVRSELEVKRLELILKVLSGKEIVVIVDVDA